MVSAFWVFGGYGAGQFIRLGSNLILTRLLVPEMFGLMALVHAILLGISLLSDVGVRDSIINTSGVSKGRFLHTAWTLQFIRGLTIFAFVCLGAPFFEQYFEYADLSLLLQVCAISIVINSLSSVNRFVLEKNLEFRPQICIEVFASLMSALSMLIFAYCYGGVWSLVVGTLVQSVCSTLLTNTVLPGKRMRLDIEWESAKNIIHLGKWIFLSTAATYVTFQGDRLILAKSISASEFGVYSIAAIFGYVLKDVVANVSSKMLMPIYRQIVEKREGLHKMLKARFLLLFVVFVVAFFLSALGEWLIRFLYDERYYSAGWVLQWLVFAGLLYSFDDTIRGFLMANRDSFHGFCVQLLKGSLLLSLALWLAPLHGIMGVLLAMALTPLLSIPYLMYVLHQHGYRWYFLDFLALGFVVVSFMSLWFFQRGVLWSNIELLWGAYF
jgi:O-antigen/teichoic acid export membrane protein